MTNIVDAFYYLSSHACRNERSDMAIESHPPLSRPGIGDLLSPLRVSRKEANFFE